MSSSQTKLENFKIPLAELNLATDNFNEENRIGEGGFGKVYKGKLSERWSNRLAAIKCLNPDGGQGKTQFMNELSLLASIHHHNIMTFIGYCDEGNEMIIVYDYATNKSLDTYLEHPEKMGLIDWVQRLHICIGVARGLNHLHSGLGEHHRIIHRDVKSANVLLDENMNAKVSDFGLSKLGLKNQPYTQLHTRFAGTDGYYDPHYYATKTLTKESDVYSFGVVLFEVLCGRLVFPEDEESPSLVELIQRQYEDGLEQIIDPHIKDQIKSLSLLTFKEIAIKCIDYDVKQRPPMDVIITKLEEALKAQEKYELKLADDWDQKLPYCDEIIRISDPPIAYNTKRELYSSLPAAILVYECHKEKYDLNKPYEWEKMLPQNYEDIIRRSYPHMACENKRELYSILLQGIHIDEGNKWFCLSKLNGKNCVTISAVELFKHHFFSSIVEGKIGWKSIHGSRFSKVAVFEAANVFSKKVRITTQMLSPETIYGVFLICRQMSQGRGSPFSSPLEFNIGGEKQFYLSTELSFHVDDKWMEMENFQFHNQLEDTHCEFSLKRNRWDRYFGDDLYVDGIEFRPLETDTNRNVETKVDNPIEIGSSVHSEQQLRNDYDEIIKRSDVVLNHMTEQQLYSLLVKGIFIDDKLMRFWLDESNGKKCLMLSMKKLTIKHEGGSAVTTDSRFKKFVEFINVKSILIRCKVKAHMLSPMSVYAAWLVFRYAPTSVNIASIGLGKHEQKSRYVYLQSSSTLVQPRKNSSYKRVIFSKIDERKLYRRPRKRFDGWMEVEIFPFFNDMEPEEEVEVALQIYYANRFQFGSSFTVHGIEFRPE